MMKKTLMNTAAIPAAAIAVLSLASAATALEVTPQQNADTLQEYSPHVNESFPQRVFWGDTHLHTTYSPDAGMLKNFNLGPDDAYRMARGDQVTANNGMQARLVRPFDSSWCQTTRNIWGWCPRSAEATRNS